MPETTNPPAKRPGWEWLDVGLWLLWVVVAVAVGWGASRIQPWFAPLLIFPLLWGLILGWSARGLAGVAPLPGWAIAGAVLIGGLLSVATLHYDSYRLRLAFLEGQAADFGLQQSDALAEALVRGLPEGEEFEISQLDQQALGEAFIREQRPTNVWEHLRLEADRGRKIRLGEWSWQLAGSGVWVLWAIEASLVLATALMVSPWRGRPA